MIPCLNASYFCGHLHAVLVLGLPGQPLVKFFLAILVSILLTFGPASLLRRPLPGLAGRAQRREYYSPGRGSAPPAG